MKNKYCTSLAMNIPRISKHHDLYEISHKFTISQLKGKKQKFGLHFAIFYPLQEFIFKHFKIHICSERDSHFEKNVISAFFT